MIVVDDVRAWQVTMASLTVRAPSTKADHMRFDLTTLRVFSVVSETGNIARAAVKISMAASAISKRISDLESECGTPLLVRRRDGVEQTPAGENYRKACETSFRNIRYSRERDRRVQ